MNTANMKQEPTIDCERFTMLFRYLSPWGFGEHAKVIARRAFRVSWIQTPYDVVYRTFVRRVGDLKRGSRVWLLSV